MSAGTKFPERNPARPASNRPASSRPVHQPASPRRLSLVHSADASAGSGGASARSARELTTLPPAARALRRRVQSDGLAVGSPVDATAVTLILAAKIVHHPGPVNLFTEDMVWQLLWLDLFSWCGNRGIRVPADIPETLWQLLCWMERNGELHPDSDPVHCLRRPLMTSGGLDDEGRARHPAQR